MEAAKGFVGGLGLEDEAEVDVVGSHAQHVYVHVAERVEGSPQEGYNPPPDDLEMAVRTQVAYDFRRRQDIGLESVSFPDGSIQKVNSGEFVFHRTRYSPKLLSGLEAVIANKRIGHHDRWGVHRDLAAMAVSGDVTIEEYLGFVERAFANEDHLLVLTNVLSALGKLGVVARGEPYHPRIGALVETLSKKTLDRLDWDVKDGEDPSDRALRADAILRLGRLGDERAVSWARDAFPRASELESNLRGAVYGISAWRGDERTFDTLLQRYKSETNPQERMKILSAGLAGFQDPALLRKALDTSLTDAIRHQDRVYLVRDMTAHGPGLDAAWHWFQETWQPKVSRLYEKGGNHVALMLHGLAPLASEDRALELESIFGQNPVSGSVAAIKQTTEEMRALAKMVKRNRSI